MKKKIGIYGLLAIASIAGLFTYKDTKLNDGKLHVVFCDVGQGDGIYIRTPKGQDIIIDGGPDNSILLCLSDNMPFWDRTIELMILTHPDSDHYTGLIPIAKGYKVLSFATSFTQKETPGYQTLSEILTEKKTKQRFVCQKDKFTFPDDVKIQIVWPSSCTLSSTDKNDNSVVAVLDYKDLEVLLTGDAEVGVGRFYQDLAGDVDILKVPHHGSKDGVDASYLEVVKPEVAVLSVGQKNRYGHPAKAIVDILKTNKSKIYRTDIQGEIVVKSDGASYSIKTGRD